MIYLEHLALYNELQKLAMQGFKPPKDGRTQVSNKRLFCYDEYLAHILQVIGGPFRCLGFCRNKAITKIPSERSRLAQFWCDSTWFDRERSL